MPVEGAHITCGIGRNFIKQKGGHSLTSTRSGPVGFRRKPLGLVTPREL